MEYFNVLKPYLKQRTRFIQYLYSPKTSYKNTRVLHRNQETQGKPYPLFIYLFLSKPTHKLNSFFLLYGRNHTNHKNAAGCIRPVYRSVIGWTANDCTACCCYSNSAATNTSSSPPIERNATIYKGTNTTSPSSRNRGCSSQDSSSNSFEHGCITHQVCSSPSTSANSSCHCSSHKPAADER